MKRWLSDSDTWSHTESKSFSQTVSERYTNAVALRLAFSLSFVCSFSRFTYTRMFYSQWTATTGITFWNCSGDANQTMDRGIYIKIY